MARKWPGSAARCEKILVPWLIAALATVALLLYALAHAVERARRRRRIVARVLRAGEGEARARAWLEQLGFEITGAQVAATYPVRVDDREVAIGVRADYLVQKDGARYVVEVKTGLVAPRVETPATRRQLIEYGIAFDVDGVLLVDAENARVHAVSFPGTSSGARAPAPRGRWAAFFVVAAAAFGLFELLRLARLLE